MIYMLPLMVLFDWIRCWGRGRSLCNCRSVLGQWVPKKKPHDNPKWCYLSCQKVCLSLIYLYCLSPSAWFVLSSVTYNRIITVVMVWSLQSSVSFKDLSTGSTPTGARAILNLATLHFCIYTFLKRQTGHFCGRPCCILHSLWLPLTGIF